MAVSVTCGNIIVLLPARGRRLIKEVRIPCRKREIQKARRFLSFFTKCKQKGTPSCAGSARLPVRLRHGLRTQEGERPQDSRRTGVLFVDFLDDEQVLRSDTERLQTSFGLRSRLDAWLGQH